MSELPIIPGELLDKAADCIENMKNTQYRSGEYKRDRVYKILRRHFHLEEPNTVAMAIEIMYYNAR
jgi:hypothetical protein